MSAVSPGGKGPSRREALAGPGRVTPARRDYPTWPSGRGAAPVGDQPMMCWLYPTPHIGPHFSGSRAGSRKGRHAFAAPSSSCAPAASRGCLDSEPRQAPSRVPPPMRGGVDRGSRRRRRPSPAQSSPLPSANRVSCRGGYRRQQGLWGTHMYLLGRSEHQRGHADGGQV